MPIKKRKPRQAADPPLDAFSDIAFQLIIFFIVATSLTKIFGFKTDMPAPEQNPSEQKTLSVQIKDNTILFNEKKVKNIDELRTKLNRLQLAKKPPDKRIVQLEVAGAIRYEDYYQYMAVINNAGGNLTIVREEEGGE